MDVAALGRGLLLGFSIAAVLGPIGVLCVRRTLAGGFVIGLLSGLGAATADAAYASLAAFGVSAVTSVLVDQRVWLRLVGGAFILYLGARTLLARPALQADARATVAGLLAAYVSTLALTLSNPMTILSFVGIFAGLGLGVVAGMTEAVSLVGGVFVGSAAWWLALATGVALLRTRLNTPAFRVVNVLSGVVIVGFGVQSLFAALF